MFFSLCSAMASTGAALLESDIDELIFTAPSRPVNGLRKPRPRLLPVTLELGGKDPMIVLDDRILTGIQRRVRTFMNVGQTCLQLSGVMLSQHLPDVCCDVCGKDKRFRVGRGSDPATDIGPLIHERQLLYHRTARGRRPKPRSAHSNRRAALPSLGRNFTRHGARRRYPQDANHAQGLSARRFP